MATIAHPCRTSGSQLFPGEACECFWLVFAFDVGVDCSIPLAIALPWILRQHCCEVSWPVIEFELQFAGVRCSLLILAFADATCKYLTNCLR